MPEEETLARPPALPADRLTDQLVLTALARCEGNETVQRIAEVIPASGAVLDLVLEHLSFHFGIQQREKVTAAQSGEIALPLDCLDASVFLAISTLQAFYTAHGVVPQITEECILLLLKVMSDRPGFFLSRRSPQWPYTDAEVDAMKNQYSLQDVYDHLPQIFARLAELKLIVILRQEEGGETQ